MFVWVEHKTASSSLPTPFPILIPATDMHVFHVTKRAYYPLTTWEPIFICSHEAPQYDERLTWEGRKDKMTHVRTGRQAD